jgi:ATP synthase protein I
LESSTPAGRLRFNKNQSQSVQRKRNDKYSAYRQIGILTTIPMLMAVGPILGYYIGSFLDKKLGTTPYLMVIFIFFGFVAAGKGVYNLIKKAGQ